ncbi:MAG TPA: glycosyltransferase 87 family protein [Candidatus Eremiobacteraceae bacterium]|nr:glycosyltransferase 87 family protein [Candidatus Eremiobacteraceae bacterium]
MRPRARVVVWTAALVFISFAGSALCRSLARSTHAASLTPGPFSFPAGRALPLSVINGADGALPLFFGFLVVFCALGFAGWRLASALRDAPGLPAWALVCAQLIVGLALSFFPVTFSSDAYAYVLFGRAHGVFGLNPYTLAAPMRVLHDAVLAPILNFFGDPPLRDDYGPLWTVGASIVGRAESHADLWTQVWTQRVIAVLSACACSMGLLRLRSDADRAARTYGVALFAFHPLVLWESAVGGHNDFVMLAAVVWAFALGEAYPMIAGVLLGIAIGIKYVPLVVLPALAGRAFRSGGFVTGVACIVVALAIPALSFAPFWAGPAMFTSLQGPASALGFSPTSIILAPLFSHGQGAILWGRLLQLTLGAVVLWLAIAAGISAVRGRWLPSFWRPVAAFIWSAPSVNTWYIAWLMPAIACGRRWGAYAWWLGALTAVHYAFDMGALGNGPSGFVVESAAIAFLLITPIIVSRIYFEGAGVSRP